MEGRGGGAAVEGWVGEADVDTGGTEAGGDDVVVEAEVEAEADVESAEE